MFVSSTSYSYRSPQFGASPKKPSSISDPLSNVILAPNPRRQAPLKPIYADFRRVTLEQEKRTKKELAAKAALEEYKKATKFQDPLSKISPNEIQAGKTLLDSYASKELKSEDPNVKGDAETVIHALNQAASKVGTRLYRAKSLQELQKKFRPSTKYGPPHKTEINTG